MSASTSRAARPSTMLRRFLAYYGPQKHLFIADTVCALVIAGIDLAFPVILRALTNGLFTEGQRAIMASIGMVAVGLVIMYLIRCACRYFVSAQGHIMAPAWNRRCAKTSSTSMNALASATSIA